MTADARPVTHHRGPGLGLPKDYAHEEDLTAGARAADLALLDEAIDQVRALADGLGRLLDRAARHHRPLCGTGRARKCRHGHLVRRSPSGAGCNAHAGRAGRPPRRASRAAPAALDTVMEGGLRLLDHEAVVGPRGSHRLRALRAPPARDVFGRSHSDDGSADSSALPMFLRPPDVGHRAVRQAEHAQRTSSPRRFSSSARNPTPPLSPWARHIVLFRPHDGPRAARAPPMSTEPLPLLPPALLRAHHCHDMQDTRFRALARLAQALWRERQGLPCGACSTRPPASAANSAAASRRCGLAGANFVDPALVPLVRRELVYREIGAVIDADRLWTNSSPASRSPSTSSARSEQDLSLATAVLRRLCPDLAGTVSAVLLEHSPGRGDPAFTGDGTAFDVLLQLAQPDGTRSFAAVELKYSETRGRPARPSHWRRGPSRGAPTSLSIPPSLPRPFAPACSRSSPAKPCSQPPCSTKASTRPGACSSSRPHSTRGLGRHRPLPHDPRTARHRRRGTHLPGRHPGGLYRRARRRRCHHPSAALTARYLAFAPVHAALAATFNAP